MRVLELAQIMAGPTCGMMLADMGADVVKVEKLPGGDDARSYREPLVNGVSAPFMMLNRNKRGIAVNLKHREGREILLRLVANADVLTGAARSRSSGSATTCSRRSIPDSSTARCRATDATARSPTRAAST